MTCAPAGAVGPRDKASAMSDTAIAACRTTVAPPSLARERGRRIGPAHSRPPDRPRARLRRADHQEMPMDLDDALRTTFSAREFTGEALPDAALFGILDRARFAPSGG